MSGCVRRSKAVCGPTAAGHRDAGIRRFGVWPGLFGYGRKAYGKVLGDRIRKRKMPVPKHKSPAAGRQRGFVTYRVMVQGRVAYTAA